GMNLDPVIQGFLDEAGDLLSDFEAALLDLEVDPGNVETLNRIFRSAHTIKGNSAMLGMDGVAGFTHCFEDLLGKLRKRGGGVTAPLMNTLLRSVDALKELLTDAKQGKFIDHAWHEELLKEFRSFADGAEPALAPPSQPAASAPIAAETLYEIYFAPPAELM